MTVQLFYSYVEIGISIIAACLPTLKPLSVESTLKLWVSNIKSKMSLQLSLLRMKRAGDRVQHALGSQNQTPRNRAREGHLAPTNEHEHAYDGALWLDSTQELDSANDPTQSITVQTDVEVVREIV